MFKKILLIISSISAINIESNPPTHVNAEILAAQQNGTHHHHYYQRPTYTRDTPTSDSVIFNAANVTASVIIQGITQGIFEGVGKVVAQKVIDALHQPADEKDTRRLLSKNQQLLNLATLRKEVSSFCEQAENNPELAPQANQLRLGYGYTLLEFITKQKKEEVCIITPLLPLLRNEVLEFVDDAKDSTDIVVTNLCTQIQKNYGSLLAKQLLYEKQASKPAIVIMARPH